MTALILSGSYLESNRYLQSEGVRGRHATNAELVGGTQFTTIVQLPSFSERPDRHAILSAIKRKTRGRKMDWDVLAEWTPPAKVQPEPEVNVYLFGDLVEANHQVAVDELADELAEGEDAPSAEDEQLQDLVESSPTNDEGARSADAPVQTGGLDETIAPVDVPDLADALRAPLDEAKEPEPKPAAKPKRPRKPVPAPPKTTISSIDDLFGDD